MRRSLTKSQIISLKTDIDNVFKAGKKYNLSCFKLLVTENKFDFSRLIVIPVRHFGNSIQRNRIRRQIKEIWRLNQQRIKSGIDCVFIVYPNKNLAYSEIEESILNLLSQSNNLLP